MTSSEISVLRTQLEGVIAEKNQVQALYQSSEIERRELRSIVNNHSNQDKESRELRATLADRNFQLKKLNQDIATEKTMIELQKIKYMKGYEQKIQELKDKIENDNQDWIKRFDLQAKQFREEEARLKHQFQNNFKKEIKEFKEISETKIEEISKESSEVVEKLKTQIAKIEKGHSEEKDGMQKQFKARLDRELKAANEKLTSELHRREKEYDLKFRLIENEKKHEETQHQQTRKQFVHAKDNLYEQIYKLKTQREDLEEKVKDLEIETQEKAKKIVALNESIKQLEIKHSEQINALSENSRRTLDNLKSKSTGDIEQVLRNQLIYVDTIEAKMKVLQQRHNDMLKQHTDQIQQIRQCFNERPSKSQDVDIIKGLKEKLWKKEKQLEFVQEEVRWFKLELDNKQEVYNKIFANGHTTQDLRPPSDKYLNMPISPANSYKSRRVGKSLILKKKPDQLRDNSATLLQIPKNPI